MDQALTDKEWERFFELLDKIIQGPGPWSEKHHALVIKAEEHDGTGNLEELAGWFASE